jgi:hypothetical protein
VTPFSPGQKIMVQWEEVIAHDGHFRISLALSSRSELSDPMTTEAAGACGFGTTVCSTGATIENPPLMPVLLDGLFVHTAASVTTPMVYKQEVTLPNVTCAKCTLQVIQFMNHHPQGYFYHHCADISIQPGGGGGGSGGSGGSGHPGGGCAVADRPLPAFGPTALLLLVALILRVRRRA